MLRRGRQRRAVARRAETGRRLVDRVGGQRAIGARLRHDLRLVGERHDADEIAGRRLGDGLLRQLLRALEAAGRRQAVRRVERDDRDAGRCRPPRRSRRTAARRRAPAARAPSTRSASSSSSRRRRLSVCSTGACLSSLHRRELHARLRLALQQVQHDRHGGRGRAGEKQGREEDSI